MTTKTHLPINIQDKLDGLLEELTVLVDLFTHTTKELDTRDQSGLNRLFFRIITELEHLGD